MVTGGLKKEVGVKNDTWRSDHDSHRNEKCRSGLAATYSQMNKVAAK